MVHLLVAAGDSKVVAIGLVDVLVDHQLHSAGRTMKAGHRILAISLWSADASKCTWSELAKRKEIAPFAISRLISRWVSWGCYEGTISPRHPRTSGDG
jgi:hypothetical protein